MLVSKLPSSIEKKGGGEGCSFTNKIVSDDVLHDDVFSSMRDILEGRVSGEHLKQEDAQGPPKKDGQKEFIIRVEAACTALSERKIVSPGGQGGGIYLFQTQRGRGEKGEGKRKREIEI